MGFEIVKQNKKKSSEKKSVEEVNNSFVRILLEEHYKAISIVECSINPTPSVEENNFFSELDDKFFDEIFVNKDKEDAKKHVLEDLSGIIEEKKVVEEEKEEKQETKEIVIDRRKRR